MRTIDKKLSSEILQTGGRHYFMQDVDSRFYSCQREFSEVDILLFEESTNGGHTDPVTHRSPEVNISYCCQSNRSLAGGVLKAAQARPNRRASSSVFVLRSN